MIIIDGHNLLWAVRKVDEDCLAFSDIQLCGVIDRYLKLTRQSGVIVFDGTGPHDKSEFDSISDLEVIFAGQDSADSVIEDKISASTAPKRLTVISSDRRLRRAAHARKATAVKSEIFWKDVQKMLKRKKTSREPAEKRQGLTESETEQWLEFFGIEQ